MIDEDPQFIGSLRRGLPPTVTGYVPWYKLSEVKDLSQFPSLRSTTEFDLTRPPSYETLFPGGPPSGQPATPSYSPPSYGSLYPDSTPSSTPSSVPSTPSSVPSTPSSLASSETLNFLNELIPTIFGRDVGGIIKQEMQDIVAKKQQDDETREEFSLEFEQLVKIRYLLEKMIGNSRIYDAVIKNQQTLADAYLDLFSFIPTTDKILSVITANNGLPHEQVLHVFEKFGDTQPSASLIVKDGQWQLFGKPVSFPDPLHIVVDNKSHLLTSGFLKLLLTSNPYIIKNYVDEFDKKKYIDMAFKHLDEEVDADSMAKLQAINSEAGKIGSGYKSKSTAMKKRQQIHTLEKKMRKRRATKNKKDKEALAEREVALAPLISEIRSLEKQVKKTKRVMKGKPTKKPTDGSGLFSNSDPFGTNARKSTRKQAEKQVKSGATFGSGLPSLDKRLTLLKGSQLAGNTGKKIQAEISKIEKKLK
jgi:hypothetical protein